MNRIYKIAKRYGKGNRARTCAAAFLAAFALTGVMGMSEAQATTVTGDDGQIGGVVINHGIYYKNTSLRDGSLFVGDDQGHFSQISPESAKLGKVTISKEGKVTATEGEVGGVVINHGIYYKNTSLRDGSLFVGDDQGHFSQISPESAKLGKVTIDKDGKVTATAGEIGGVTVNKGMISNGAAKIALYGDSGVAGMVNGKGASIYMQDGNTVINSKVAIDKDGKVTATAGEIGGVTLNKGMISNGAAKIALYGDSGVAGMVNGKGASIYMQDGNTVINSKVAIDKDGKVTGVAAGAVTADSKDAVNGGQLYATNQLVKDNASNISLLSNSIDKLDNRVDKVGAGAAALAALHPLDFDPEDKWDFAAGYGNYSGASAVALGAYYRPNEDTMFSVGGSFGNGENMVNAGVSLKLGQSNHAPASKAAMEKKISALSQEVEELKAAIADLRAAQTKAKDATEKDAQKK